MTVSGKRNGTRPAGGKGVLTGGFGTFQGEGHGEPGAGLRPADHLDGPSQKAGEFVGNRQPQSCPGTGSPPFAVDLKKRLEEMGKGVGLDPDAGILDLDPHSFLVGPGIYSNLDRPDPGKFDGIRDQVGENLAEHSGVGKKRGKFRTLSEL